MNPQNFPIPHPPSIWVFVRIMATTFGVLIGASMWLGAPDATSQLLALQAGFIEITIEALLALRKMNRRIRKLRREMAEAGSQRRVSASEEASV